MRATKVQGRRGLQCRSSWWHSFSRASSSSFWGIMAYLILGLAPSASPAWSGPERREARCR
jgi:hypothetical protein